MSRAAPRGFSSHNLRRVDYQANLSTHSGGLTYLSHLKVIRSVDVAPTPCEFSAEKRRVADLQRTTDPAPQDSTTNGLTDENEASAPKDVETEPPPTTAPAETRAQADKLVAEGKKAIALKQWEEGVGKYADALDLM